ncbi:MAG TPA: hypothetical protein PK619_02410 [bacterium]|nr:hypothetical protein [bacterium]HPN81568.1 hypothetical protein [bacterium]HPW39551.1 hypothetical protein [bacterium]
MKKTISTFIVVLLMTVLVTPTIALATDSGEPLENWGLDAAAEFGLGNTGLVETVTQIIQVLLGFLGILAVLLILWGGFIWMTAAGDDAKVDKAKKLIVSGIIGIVIIFSAYAIASFVITQIATATNAGA